MTPPSPRRRPKEEVKTESPSRSPIRRPRTPAIRTRLADEDGGELETTIPPVAKKRGRGRGAKWKGSGPVAKAKQEIQREAGESRKKWKDRVFSALKKKG